MFTVLKTIRADDKIFARPHPDSKAEDHTDDEPAIDRLIDVLPKTLEKICLIVHENKKRMFEGLAEMKQERLPMLKNLILENGCPFDQHVEKALEAVGISVSH